MEKVTIIAIVILALVIGACAVSSIVRSVVARRSGEGKKHRAEPIGTFIVGIDGMHCDHCRVAIQECLNKIDGVIEESELREAIEKTGYGVDYIKRQ